MKRVFQGKKTSNKSKVVVGWNDHVEHYFRTSLFWHMLWEEKGRPQDGIIANIRRTTRAHYHKARKFAIKHKDILQSERLAESHMNDTSTEFWQNVKKCRPKKQSLPTTVDDAQNPKNISDLFKTKFDEIYNSISYNEEEMNELRNTINDSIIKKNSNVTPQ